jgi:hypothetical protein
MLNCEKANADGDPTAQSKMTFIFRADKIADISRPVVQKVLSFLNETKDTSTAN